MEHRAHLQAEIRRATSGDRTGQRRARLMRKVSLPAQAAAMRTLTKSLQELIFLERQAYGIPAGATGLEAHTADSDEPARERAEQVRREGFGDLREAFARHLAATEAAGSATDAARAAGGVNF